MVGDRSGLISLLHDEMAGPGRDDRLDVRELVAGNDHEPLWVRANLLVLMNGEFDELIAPEAGALATESDRAVLIPWPLAALDPLVHVADRRLVGAGAPLLVGLHSGILACVAHPCHSRRTEYQSQRSDDQRELLVGHGTG